MMKNKFSAVDRPRFLRRVATFQQLRIPRTIQDSDTMDEDSDSALEALESLETRSPGHVHTLASVSDTPAGLLFDCGSAGVGIDILDRNRESPQPCDRAVVPDQLVVSCLQSLKNLSLKSPDEDSDFEQHNDDDEDDDLNSTEYPFSLSSCSIIEQYFSEQETSSDKLSLVFDSTCATKGGRSASLYSNARCASSNSSLASSNSCDFRSPSPWSFQAEPRVPSDPIPIPRRRDSSSANAFTALHAPFSTRDSSFAAAESSTPPSSLCKKQDRIFDMEL